MAFFSFGIAWGSPLGAFGLDLQMTQFFHVARLQPTQYPHRVISHSLAVVPFFVVHIMVGSLGGFCISLLSGVLWWFGCWGRVAAALSVGGVSPGGLPRGGLLLGGLPLVGNLCVGGLVVGLYWELD